MMPTKNRNKWSKSKIEDKENCDDDNFQEQNFSPNPEKLVLQMNSKHDRKVEIVEKE